VRVGSKKRLPTSKGNGNGGRTAALTSLWGMCGVVDEMKVHGSVYKGKYEKRAPVQVKRSEGRARYRCERRFLRSDLQKSKN